MYTAVQFVWAILCVFSWWQKFATNTHSKDGYVDHLDSIRHRTDGHGYWSRILKKYSTSNCPSSGKSVQWTAFWAFVWPNNALSDRGRRCRAISWKHIRWSHTERNSLQHKQLMSHLLRQHSHSHEYQDVLFIIISTSISTSYSFEWSLYEWSIYSDSYKHKHLYESLLKCRENCEISCMSAKVYPQSPIASNVVRPSKLVSYIWYVLYE